MAPDPRQEITALLRAWSGGDEAALERLVPLVDGELRRIARRCLEARRPGATLETTSLVNEAYVRLIDLKQAGWRDRVRFFALCARIMRGILVDQARAQHRQKRGVGAPHVSVEGIQVGRDWKVARMWLLRELSRAEPAGA